MHYYLKISNNRMRVGEKDDSQKIVQILQYDLHSYGEYDIL